MTENSVMVGLAMYAGLIIGRDYVEETGRILDRLSVRDLEIVKQSVDEFLKSKFVKEVGDGV